MDYTLAASDYLFEKQMNEGSSLPSRRWDEMPFVKSFRREEYGKYDRYLNTMYETLEAADQIYNSIQFTEKLEETPRTEARLEHLETKYEGLLYARDEMKPAAKQIAKVNKDIREVYADKAMTPDEKRTEIDTLLAERSEIAKEVYDYRLGGSKNEPEGGAKTKSYLDTMLDALSGKSKSEQVDGLLEESLPHTATLINDITISDAKLRKANE